MQYDEAMRDKQINIRLTADEAELLEKLASTHDTTAAGIVRKLLKGAEGYLSTEWRWNHVKAEALDMAAQADIAGLKMWFNDAYRVIYLDDGVDAVTLCQGDGVWFTLAQWPGSKLGPQGASGAKPRKRLPQECIQRYEHKTKPVFETPPKAKR